MCCDSLLTMLLRLENILRIKSAFKMKYKVFLIIFEGLSLKQIKSNFFEDESPTLNNCLFPITQPTPINSEVVKLKIE